MNVALTVSAGELTALVGSYVWPFARIVGLVMVAPVFSAAMVTPRLRVLIAIALALIVVPLLPAGPADSPLSVAGALITAQQLIIGLAMGLTLQMVFDALIVAGQAAAMSMGLGFAIAVDPARGVNVPIVSQYFMVLATLVFLALDGHLMVIETLVLSFQVLPVGGGGLSAGGVHSLLMWGSYMFAGALKIALPAMAALLIVNLAFGVISRAAPTLNLFAVGFPITMLLGFVILMVSVPNIVGVFGDMLSEAFEQALRVVGGGP